MKLDIVNKPTIVNIFGFHTLNCKITRLAIITRNTTIKTENLSGGRVSGKESPFLPLPIFYI